MFARVAGEELQREQTWSVAWKWISHYWVKRCYRDLTGKLKQKSTRQGNANEQPPHEPLPLPPEDVIRRIHRLTSNETITDKMFKHLINWIGALHALYSSADVQALMDLSLLHLIGPGEVEDLLREASEHTQRPTCLLRFSSRSELLALNVYKGRMLVAAVPISDHSDRGLRGALVQVMNLLRRPEHEGTLAVLSTRPPYRTYDIKGVEGAIKQLKCMKDNPDLPTNYINPVDVGPALLQGGTPEQKRKRSATDSPVTTPDGSCSSSYAASPFASSLSPPTTRSEEEEEEEVEEMEMERGLVLLEMGRAAVVDVLYSRAMEDEGVARELYARLHQRFGHWSMEPQQEQEASLPGGGEGEIDIDLEAELAEFLVP